MTIGGKEYGITYGQEGEFPCLRIDIDFKSPNPIYTQTLTKSVLIDTGSDFTLVSKEIISPLRLLRTGRIEQVEGFNGEFQNINFYSCRIIIDELIDEIWEVGIIDTDFILGMDFIKKWQLFIDCTDEKFEIVNR